MLGQSAGSESWVRERWDVPSGDAVILVIRRCGFGTGAGHTSFPSSGTSGSVNTISYRCCAFRKPTWGDRERQRGYECVIRSKMIRVKLRCALDLLLLMKIMVYCDNQVIISSPLWIIVYLLLTNSWITVDCFIDDDIINKRNLLWPINDENIVNIFWWI